MVGQIRECLMLAAYYTQRELSPCKNAVCDWRQHVPEIPRPVWLTGKVPPCWQRDQISPCLVALRRKRQATYLLAGANDTQLQMAPLQRSNHPWSLVMLWLTTHMLHL